MVMRQACVVALLCLWSCRPDREDGSHSRGSVGSTAPITSTEPPSTTEPTQASAPGTLSSAAPAVSAATTGKNDAPDEARVQIVIREPLDPSLLTVSLRDAHQSWQWRGADFRSAADSSVSQSPIHSTHTSGDLVVSFTLRDTKGAVAARGSVTLPLRPDWRWNIDFFNMTGDPRGGCLGCDGSKAFKLPPALRT